VIKYDSYTQVVNILPAGIPLENKVEGGEIKISYLAYVKDDIIITVKTKNKIETYIITLEIPGTNFVRYFHFAKEVNHFAVNL